MNKTIYATLTDSVLQDFEQTTRLDRDGLIVPLVEHCQQHLPGQFAVVQKVPTCLRFVTNVSAEQDAWHWTALFMEYLHSAYARAYLLHHPFKTLPDYTRRFMAALLPYNLGGDKAVEAKVIVLPQARDTQIPEVVVFNPEDDTLRKLYGLNPASIPVQIELWNGHGKVLFFLLGHSEQLLALDAPGRYLELEGPD